MAVAMSSRCVAVVRSGPPHLLSLVHGVIFCHSNVKRPHLLEDTGSLCSILALHANLAPVLVEEEGKGDTGQGKEGWDGASPLDTEAIIHLSCEQRKGGAKK